MSSVVNPVFAYGMVPGMNPTGNQMPSYGGVTSSRTGANPLLPSVNAGASSPTSTNPYSVVPTTSMTTPSFPANTGGGYTSSGPTANLGTPGGGTAGGTGSNQFGGFLSGMTGKDISRLFDSLKKTYGDGMAHMILDFLQGGAGFNQQAVNNLLASLQPGIERGTESIEEQFSVMGNRFGSPAGIATGDYLSQVNLNEGQLITQMYEQALDRFMSVMMGTAGAESNRIANQPSGLDAILGGLKIGGAAAGAASAAGVGGTAGTILDVLAAAGAAA